MKTPKLLINVLLMALSVIALGQESNKGATKSASRELMVRIAEIEIEPNYLNEYIAILKEEAGASVQLEPGVICIYPMYQKENPTQIRLLEIYANKEAYESHLQTPHFKHYKETTLEMVNDLKLIDMEAIDVETMPMIFRKFKN